MTELEIVALDPFDDAAFDAWHDVYVAAEQAPGPDVAAPWQLEEVRAPDAGARAAASGTPATSGLVDGRVVAVGWVRLPLLDNPDRAEVAVHTLPDDRRRGHGTAMLAHIEAGRPRRGRTHDVRRELLAVRRRAGRRRSSPGRSSRAAHGYALALGDVKRRLRCRSPTACSTSSRPRPRSTTTATRCAPGSGRSRTSSSTAGRG